MPGIIIDGDSSIIEKSENIEIRGELVRHGFVTLKRGPEKTMWIEAVHPKDLPTFDGPLYQVDQDKEQDVLIFRQVQIQFSPSGAAPKAAGSLEDVLREAFNDFYESLSHSSASWFAKERDCVNRFVMGHLMQACSPGSPLECPTQIGTEIAVRTPRGLRQGKRTKRSSQKDLVIWDSRFGTCWTPDMKPRHAPLAVIEWKSRHPKGKKQNTADDCEWLQAFCEENQGSQGYSVLLGWTPSGRLREITVRQCSAGGTWDESWFQRSL
jgi:hypothetical protein